MTSILCYMTLLLCAVALSEGCSCAEPVPPPDWKGNAYEYWNKQRLCAADYGEIPFWNCLVLNQPHWIGRLAGISLHFSEKEHAPKTFFFLTQPLKSLLKIWRRAYLKTPKSNLAFADATIETYLVTWPLT